MFGVGANLLVKGQIPKDPQKQNFVGAGLGESLGEGLFFCSFWEDWSFMGGDVCVSIIGVLMNPKVIETPW